MSRRSATIPFHGRARVLELDQVDEAVLRPLFRGLDLEATDECVVEVTPHGRFLTYGIDVSLLTLRSPQKARGTAPV